MDKELVRLMGEDTPKLNPILANGLITTQIKEAMRFIDSLFRSVSKSFPEGLEYVGCARATPKEEYIEVTSRRNKNNQRSFDIAHSDLYAVKFFFKFHGQDLPPRMIYLPFVHDGGYIRISGASYVIAPILNDIVISISDNDVFVRFIRDKIIFKRINYAFVVDGDRIENYQVLWAAVHNSLNKPGEPKGKVRAKTILAHYLFAKYGVTKSFKDFAHTDVVIDYLNNLTKEKYPEDKWIICSSRNIRPKGVQKGFWEPTQVAIAIPRENYNKMSMSLIVGFFYILDHFPSRIKPEWIDHVRLWKVLLGHLIKPAAGGEGVLHDSMDDHIRSLDDYIDPFMVEQLRGIGYEIHDIYQFFALMIERYDQWLLEGSRHVNSMYGKELATLNFLLYDIVVAIVRVSFELTASSKTRKLTPNDVNKILSKRLTMRIIYAITKSHGEVRTETTPNDSKALRITNMLIPQSSSSKQKKKQKLVLNDPSIRMHESVIEIGSYSALPKSAPDGRSRLNLFALVDDKHRIIRNDKFKELLDTVGKMMDISRIDH